MTARREERRDLEEEAAQAEKVSEAGAEAELPKANGQSGGVESVA